MNSTIPLRAVDEFVNSRHNPISANQFEQSSFKKPETLELQNTKIKISFAEDQESRNKYYKLRHRLFTEVDEAYRLKHPEDCLDWEDYDGSEQEDDRCGRILVATDPFGNVVAGIRLLFCDWIDRTANEVPEIGFTIRAFLQKVGLNPNAKYAEIEDAVIERRFRDRRLLKKMFSVLIDECKELDCDYMIGVAIKVATRSHKITFASLGYKMDLMHDYPWVKQRNHGYETRYPVVAYLK